MPPGGDTTVQLSHVMRGAKLVQTLQGRRGGVRRIYTPQPDGKLLLQVTMYSERLPKNVVYDLQYPQQPASATTAP